MVQCCGCSTQQSFCFQSLYYQSMFLHLYFLSSKPIVKDLLSSSLGNQEALPCFILHFQLMERAQSMICLPGLLHFGIARFHYLSLYLQLLSTFHEASRSFAFFANQRLEFQHCYKCRICHFLCVCNLVTLSGMQACYS